jgi:4-aminobutyrate aminotransferase
MGDYILDQLRVLQKRFSLIGDIRGKGLMIGVELVRDPVTKEKAVEERDRIIQACFEKGLLILGCGENVFRLIPPLIITRKEADTALTILEEVFQKMN